MFLLNSKRPSNRVSARQTSSRQQLTNPPAHRPLFLDLEQDFSPRTGDVTTAAVEADEPEGSARRTPLRASALLFVDEDTFIDPAVGVMADAVALLVVDDMIPVPFMATAPGVVVVGAATDAAPFTV